MAREAVRLASPDAKPAITLSVTSLSASAPPDTAPADTAPADTAAADTAAPETAASPRPRVRLVPSGTGRGVLDGGWWPRSRDTAAELTELLTALAGPGGAPASLVTIDFYDWDEIPLRITVRGREIRVGWLAHLDHVVAVTRGQADPLLLLVVPPGAAPASAEAALARSAIETGDMMPQEILASCDISTERV
ncbi:DUF5994 family protein [Actinomadura livida]|uniref:Uncharacterized protein n=1 Tax=Actinomadura livida TaxID=79909 RepID=A0A7W7IK64_9ACTN|nr:MULTISPECIES: DUF5994 family protein [Actinomadura]MBB4778572.1 hypothetical protein [Actinomadura catellatispora]GGU29935.1 hypothetical protein GCM10010208_63350 [Actinomadura livida]